MQQTKNKNKTQITKYANKHYGTKQQTENDINEHEKILMMTLWYVIECDDFIALPLL